MTEPDKFPDSVLSINEPTIKMSSFKHKLLPKPNVSLDFNSKSGQVGCPLHTSISPCSYWQSVPWPTLDWVIL